MVFGLDEKSTRQFRVHVSYAIAIFILFAILITVFSAINLSNQKAGAVFVLVCFACIGFGSSLTEAFAALFPILKFS
ncbi:hypothetical protein V7S43_010197 [Phytophthora oleae]|uniref:ABC-2 type transporter domain-containing protein n=1 Tax=Phytophthora oleae TaxID=2107226 RepID=A0ABD3FF52_9STRA